MPPAPTLSAQAWYASLPAPVSTASWRDQVSLRRYADTPADICQPALQQTILCMHLGGPKRVRRTSGGRAVDHEIGLGALTIMPAGESSRWRTTGPIAYAHLILQPRLLDQIADDEHGRPRSCDLRGRVGVRDGLLEQAFRRLAVLLDLGVAADRLYVESLLVVVAAGLARDHSRAAEPPEAAALPNKGGMAGWRLKRVLDLMHAKLGEDLTLDELTAASGLSRAQFYRAFRQSTGCGPHARLEQLRLERARLLLETSTLTELEIAADVGMPVRFAATFRRRYGVSPLLYRLSRS